MTYQMLFAFLNMELFLHFRYYVNDHPHFLMKPQRTSKVINNFTPQVPSAGIYGLWF